MSDLDGVEVIVYEPTQYLLGRSETKGFIATTPARALVAELVRHGRSSTLKSNWYFSRVGAQSTTHRDPTGPSHYYLKLQRLPFGHASAEAATDQREEGAGMSRETDPIGFYHRHAPELARHYDTMDL